MTEEAYALKNSELQWFNLLLLTREMVGLSILHNASSCRFLPASHERVVYRQDQNKHRRAGLTTLSEDL